eukprot:15062333-Ditylum_brightwellii.AAC.1
MIYLWHWGSDSYLILGVELGVKRESKLLQVAARSVQSEVESDKFLKPLAHPRHLYAVMKNLLELYYIAKAPDPPLGIRFISDSWGRVGSQQ